MSRDPDVLIFLLLVFLQFSDACFITGKKLLSAFCSFDYVAVVFFLLTDRWFLLIPGAVFQSNSHYISKVPFVKCFRRCNAPLDWNNLKRCCAKFSLRNVRTHKRLSAKPGMSERPQKKPVLSFALIRGNARVVFSGIRPCHCLAGSASPPSHVITN